ELGEALLGELLRLVPPLGETLLLLAKALAQLVLELDELFHELGVEFFLFLRELTLCAFALADLPLLDARDLGVALLFEGSDHRVDTEVKPAALIRHPPLDPLGGLLDRALELFARRRAKRILRFDRLDDRVGRGFRNRDLGSRVRRPDVFGDVEAVGIFEGGRERDLRTWTEAQAQ